MYQQALTELLVTWSSDVGGLSERLRVFYVCVYVFFFVLAFLSFVALSVMFL
jgi:hypothetical protein